MRIADLLAAAPTFIQRLRTLRATVQHVNWYPYDTIGNVYILNDLLARDTIVVPKGGTVIDVGCADGDLGLLFGSLGCPTDFLDNAATNFNACEGVKRSAELLGHTGRIIERDMDFGFELEGNYDLALFLGTLYHLRNPALALLRLAERCTHMLLSTRIFRRPPGGDGHMSAGDLPLGYLLDTLELNNDPTNWWIFSPPGLIRLLKRCGWHAVQYGTVGAVNAGDPVDRDERMFVFCRRVSDHSDLTSHHHF